MEELFLIYVNYVGKNWCDNNLYEFIFSDTKEDVDGEFWDTYPASSAEVTPPKVEVIHTVGVLETEMTLDVIAQSDTFSVWDSVDGVAALAFENILEYERYPDNRLVFRFGEPISSVKDVLYSRDITLEYKIIKNED